MLLDLLTQSLITGGEAQTPKSPNSESTTEIDDRRRQGAGCKLAFVNVM